MKKTTRSLLLGVVASAMLLPVCASQNERIREFQIRALLAPDSSTPVTTDANTAAPTSTQAPTVTTAAPSTAAPTTTLSSTAAASKADTTSPQPSSSAATSAGSTATSTSHSVASSAVATTDSAGQVITSFVQYTPTPSSPAPSATQTSSSSGDSGGLSTGSIIGLSVSGGIAALGIILFFVWKFTRKRFSDFDDNEAIKWPELNAHNNDVHALPTNSTGRAGFGPENDSDANLTRAPSPGAYANSIGASSVPEMYGTGDPYAVPPLPHLNPNQPYRDEPGGYGQPAGFYDPYRGPVPNTFTDTMSDAHGAESIPMTQMARIRSPAPQIPYDMQGRSSPAPPAAMGYTATDERSRTPTAFGTGRASPSPYGYGPQ